ncbi:MAG: phosphatidate cytidylyltransferase [Puniceicoccales bacterium]|jgi:phosphatidate cytidylyltransferase|nr:phosphatidate cytidylyltransferase [Puniceicoccales bacterium]
MMKERIISTIVLFLSIAGILAVMGVFGGVLVLTFFSALTQWELYQLMEKIGWKPHKKSATIFGIIILMGSFFSGKGLFDFHYDISMLALTIGIFASHLVSMGKPEDLKSIFLPTIFGILYVPIMLCIPLSFIRELSLLWWESNLPLLFILWIIVVTKFSDIGGLIIGSKFGKHKLAPVFSPQKTYEGLLGSILFSIAAGRIFAFCCGHSWPSHFMDMKMDIVSVLIATIALISDLVESGFKRLAGEKDSGNTISGIGGAFDLMDSLILTLPMGVIIIREFILF